MPILKDQPYGNDAYIYNKITGDAVSIQFKNRCTYKMAELLGLTVSYSKLGYYDYTEITTLYYNYNNTDIIALGLVEYIKEQQDIIDLFNKTNNITESKFVIVDLTNYMDVKKPKEVHLDEIKTAIDFNKIHMKTYNYLVRVNRFRTLENTSKLFVNIVNNLIK